MRPRWINAWATAAIVLTAIAQVELWLLWMPDPDEANGPVPFAIRAAAALGAAPLTLSLAFAGRWAAVSLAAAIPAVALLPAGPLETSVAVAVAIAIAAFRAALWATSTAELVVGGVALLGVVAATVVVHPGTVDEIGDLVLLILVLAGPFLAGVVMRSRLARERELESTAAGAAAAGQAEAAAAVAHERARIARELHDVVAHAISVIVLQARGGRRTLGQDPEAAARALDVIEMTASRALGEMRRLVDVMRPDDDVGALAPPPGLGELETLVTDVRAAGLAVDVRIEGTPVELAPGIDLAAYRLVQEALTNTLQHAPAPATAHVVVRYLPETVEVDVSDDGPGTSSAGAHEPGPDPSHGMIGMRERAALYGGSVEFGRRPNGGFRVLARLPIGQRAT
jgi:signal transduction histidine kinase